MKADILSVLLEELYSLPAILAIWREEIFYLEEIVIERHLNNITDNLENLSSIHSGLLNTSKQFTGSFRKFL